MGLTMRPGQDPLKKEKELTSTKQSENFQNQKVVSLFLGITTQGLTTHWRISLRYNPTTGEILEFYVNPTGKTDAIAAQHDVDYSVCGNDRNPGDIRRCKNKADRKMVKSLDAIPWKERQWGHALARNVIDVKQKLGLGVSGARGASRPKNGKRFWVKAGLKIWQMNFISQSGGSSQRGELFHMGLTTFGRLIWSRWENFQSGTRGSNIS